MTDLLKQLQREKAHIEKIEHADAMVADVYQVTKANGDSCILKISSRPDDCLRELFFLNRLKDLLPVPEVLQADSHALLMEKINGKHFAPASIKEETAYEIGALLATLHLQKTAAYGDLIHPETLSTSPAQHFAAKFEEGLAECASHLPEDLIKKCHEQFSSLLPLLKQVDGPCLVHRDYRLGNILIENNKVQGVLDWASARSGFAEEDFCAFEESDIPKKPFLQGYASIRPLPRYHKLLPLLHLSKAIASIGFTVKRGTWNGKDAAFYSRHLQFLQSV